MRRFISVKERMAVTGRLAVVVLLAILAACSSEPSVSNTAATQPALAATETVATTEAIEPTQTPDATSTPAPTATPVPASRPNETPPSPTAETPKSSPTVTPKPQPTPTLTPVQNLLDGLPWTGGFADEFERRASSAITNIAELDIDQGRLLAASDWVTYGITAPESSALETLADIFSADLDLGTALSDLKWLQDSSVSAQTKGYWLESFLVLSPHPSVSVTIASLPWVIEGHTSDRRIAQRNLALIAETNSNFLEQLLKLPWLQDDISPDETLAIQELANLEPSSTQQLIGLDWFSDSLTESESTLISRLAAISEIDPDLPPALLELEWIRDGISANDELAIGLLALLSQPTIESVAIIPWFQTGPIGDQEIESLKAIARLDNSDPELGIQVAGMAFFRGSSERHDVGAVDAINTLKDDPEDWALLSKQSWYKDGVSDDEAVVLTVLPGQANSVPTDYQSLVDNKFYLETGTEPLPLSTSVNLYLVRFLEHQTESATMIHLRSAVGVIEDYMGFPLPVKEIIMLFSTNIDAGGINYGTHFTLDVSEDASLPQLIEGGIVHEISHFYRVADSAWFGEGTANFLATHVGFELYRQEVAPRSNQSTCPNDVTNITEIEAAYPGFYPEPIAHRFCYHNYGEKIIRGLKTAMGAEPFQTAWREIFQTGIEEDRTFTDPELYQLFIKNTPADKIAGVNQVFVRFHGGDFIQ